MQPRNHQKRKRQSFLHGALILTVSMILVKLIGAMFKIPLTWIITEEGLGYFNTAYHFYSPIHSLATAGFPLPLQEWFLKIWRVEDMPMYGESINYPFPYF